MGGAPRRATWATTIGYAVGVGLGFAATLGVWLQYATATFTALTGGLVGLGVGMLVGGGWALLRRGG